MRTIAPTPLPTPTNDLKPGKSARKSHDAKAFDQSLRRRAGDVGGMADQVRISRSPPRGKNRAESLAEKSRAARSRHRPPYEKCGSLGFERISWAYSGTVPPDGAAPARSRLSAPLPRCPGHGNTCAPPSSFPLRTAPHMKSWAANPSPIPPDFLKIAESARGEKKMQKMAGQRKNVI